MKKILIMLAIITFSANAFCQPNTSRTPEGTCQRNKFYTTGDITFNEVRAMNMRTQRGNTEMPYYTYQGLVDGTVKKMNGEEMVKEGDNIFLVAGGRIFYLFKRGSSITVKEVQSEDRIKYFLNANEYNVYSMKR